MSTEDCQIASWLLTPEKDRGVPRISHHDMVAIVLLQTLGVFGHLSGGCLLIQAETSIIPGSVV